MAPASPPRTAGKPDTTAPSVDSASDSREEQLISRVDRDRVTVSPDADGAAKADPAPAHDAWDVRAAVEHCRQVPGSVGDLAGQHRVPCHRPDLDDAEPGLHGGPARLGDPADRRDARRRSLRLVEYQNVSGRPLVPSSKPAALRVATDLRLSSGISLLGRQRLHTITTSVVLTRRPVQDMAGVVVAGPGKGYPYTARSPACVMVAADGIPPGLMGRR